MKWIRTQKKLPVVNTPVLILIRYIEDDEFQWTESEMLDTFNGYKEPLSGASWNMGSAKNYFVTHWCYVDAPKN